MPSARIREMFPEGVGHKRVPPQRRLELEALLPEHAARPGRRGVTVKVLYEEHRKTHPDGYRHAGFGNCPMRYRMLQAMFPCSRYTCCEAIRSQSRQNLVKACENALYFYGEIPMAMAPGNLKAAVARGDRNEPAIKMGLQRFPDTADAPYIPHGYVTQRTRPWWKMP